VSRISDINPAEVDLEDRVMEKGINRCAHVMKGGRRFGFSALVVAGDGKGIVGYGFGKATDVPGAIEKASKDARKRLIRAPITATGSIPHTIRAKFCASKVLMMPASEGTGVIAGAAIRSVLEMAGYKNVLAKSLGSNNPINLVKAAIEALAGLRTKEEVAALRGVTLE